METYNGHVRTPADAIILFEACRLGILPRVQRRLSEKERQSINSGSVFVWDEREAGMRRWTDGKSWSASRVSGSFLTYREMEGKRGGGAFAPPLAASRAGKTPDSTGGSDSDLEMAGDDGHDGYRYKPDGLMKQSFSITTSSGNHLHLISYYARSHPNAAGLSNPTSDPQLRHIRPQKGMYPESTVHEQQSIPAVTRAPMVSAPYSTVPHMAGYARANPSPQPPQYAQAQYGWAPPPPMYNGQQFPYQYGPPGPPNGHSPLAYSQSAQMPPSQPPTSQPQQHHSPHPNYDRSPHPNDNFGHRPPPPYHRTSSSGSGQPQYNSHPSSSPGIPQYNPNPSPVPQPQHVAYQQMQQQLAQQPRPQSQPHPSSVNPSATPPMSKIDPRLMAPSPLMQQQSSNTSHSRSPSPMPAKLDSSHSTPVHANGTVAASTIPSIGSIMNGSVTDNSDAKSDRGGSRSPGGSKRTTTHDLPNPNDKVGFHEDARALRVLDRVFKT